MSVTLWPKNRKKVKTFYLYAKLYFRPSYFFALWNYFHVIFSLLFFILITAFNYI